jgi:hypothetical protein
VPTSILDCVGVGVGVGVGVVIGCTCHSVDGLSCLKTIVDQLNRKIKS